VCGDQSDSRRISAYLPRVPEVELTRAAISSLAFNFASICDVLQYASTCFALPPFGACIWQELGVGKFSHLLLRFPSARDTPMRWAFSYPERQALTSSERAIHHQPTVPQSAAPPFSEAREFPVSVQTAAGGVSAIISSCRHARVLTLSPGSTTLIQRLPKPGHKHHQSAIDKEYTNRSWQKRQPHPNHRSDRTRPLASTCPRICGCC